MFALMICSCASKFHPTPSHIAQLQAIDLSIITPLPSQPSALLTAVKKHSDHRSTDVARIYIEGDGRIYITAGVPTRDPTPTTSPTLALMRSDPSPIVGYIARPCQYVQQPSCHYTDWTSARYDTKHIPLFQAAIDDIKQHTGARAVELIGYSGGASYAMILAHRRDDVVSVQTIAGNMLPAQYQIFHNYNDVDLISAIQPVPLPSSVRQWHVVSKRDQRVPPELLQHFATPLRLQTQHQSIVELPTHDNGWSINQLLPLPILPLNHSTTKGDEVRLRQYLHVARRLAMVQNQ